MKAIEAGVEAGVERVEHRAAHRHAVMTFEHRGGVGEHDRDRVAARETSLGERGGELLRSRVELAIIAAQGARGRSRADPETPPPSAQGRSAASAAENWPDCDRGRGHRAKGTSSGAPQRFEAIIARFSKLWARQSAIPTAERRKTESRRRSEPLQRRCRRRRTAAGSPASRRFRLEAQEKRRPNRRRS